MSLSNTSETAILNQIFVGTALAWNGNTNLWLAFHTADPGEAGSAVTNEVSTGQWDTYARKSLARASDFSVSGNQVSNANLAQFVASGGGSGTTLTHVSVVTTASGAGTIIASAELDDPIVVGTGTQPQFAPGALVFTID